MTGYIVDPEQLRAHASNLEQFKTRFEALKSASANIAQDDEAYGQLCGWISGLLEERHQRQDGLVAYVEENIGLAAESMRAAADAYEQSDHDSSLTFDEITAEIGG
ncbi:type VII secretion target [Glycomyces harbinensis]|uniref:Excreted virulence factor EspC, type VII ESX diderm n=1 Tax=Glycomyces harbinensis TaxID=58114 RepID=A0A1G7B0S3_9ACTN|nr:type VII secretion target [Glycomyces harbinensis]SDE20718.1 Excreted virulence factor EspC, type VII ESX diderm [Glycomyces harbinensis]